MCDLCIEVNLKEKHQTEFIPVGEESGWIWEYKGL